MSIYLSQKHLKNLLEYHPDGYLVWKIKKSNSVTIGVKSGSISNGYRVVCVDGKTYKEHRLIWLYHYGYMPKYNIDHINRIKSDNRIENLRLCINGQKDNLQNINIKINNKTGCTGVSFIKSRNKYLATIMLNTKTLYLGSFNLLEDAIEARKKAELKYFSFIGGDNVQKDTIRPE